MKLIIANKNYSSWSMRPWILLKQLGIPFEEEKLSFNAPDFKKRVLAVNPAGLVPVLIDGDVTVWDSLAIVETVAEKFPDRGVWPAAAPARARARSICAEMHSGFSALRSRLGMNIEARLPMPTLDLRTQRDVARVCDIWQDARRFAPDGAGPYLFGAFSAADAFYAPVVARFVTYGIALPDAARRYVETMWAASAVKEWVAEAVAEHDWYQGDEDYRQKPGK
jgi:glutathione S-transferase